MLSGTVRGEVSRDGRVRAPTRQTVVRKTGRASCANPTIAGAACGTVRPARRVGDRQERYRAEGLFEEEFAGS